ncbi:MAG: DUF2062 domain-containing protein [Deltaproteobacteria bacterium]|nr:DUF2062 domain-containing protein [Deltaproteobacteria bacterium]
MDLRDAFRTRVYRPMVALLRQGLTPGRLAFSVVLGGALGIIPVPWVSTVMCGVIALVFRLNQVAIQIGNVGVYPLQFLLFLPYVRAGEWLFGVEPLPFSVTQLAEMLQADPVGTLREFGETMARAVVAWLVLTPPVAVIAYALLKPIAARLVPTAKGP